MSGILMAVAGAAPLLSASVSPTFASGSNGGFGVSGFVITDSTVTVTPINPIGGISYSWTRISGSINISATAPTNATTAFSGASITGFETATFRCTITDASTGQTATVDIPVDLTWTDFT